VVLIDLNAKKNIFPFVCKIRKYKFVSVIHRHKHKPVTQNRCDRTGRWAYFLREEFQFPDSMNETFKRGWLKHMWK